MNCQKCRTPLKLDGTLQNPSAADLELLFGDRNATQDSASSFATTDSLNRKGKYDAAALKAGPPLFKRTMPSPWRGITPKPAMPASALVKDNASMSFVVLQDSQFQAPSVVAKQQAKELSKTTSDPLLNTSEHYEHDPSLLVNVDASNRLFAMLSSHSDVDHPICSDCADILISSLQSRLAASLKERDAYVGYLNDLKHSAPSEEQVVRAAEELSEAENSEDKVFKELLDLEREKAKFEEELAALDEESRQLDADEREFWKARNEFDQRLASFRDSCDAMNAHIAHDLQQLGLLERTNVYNDTFFISHDGPFGTINGLRLGRLSPPNNVEWAEINAAWGTTALLIATVAQRLKFSFVGYVLRPMGSTSHIEKFESVPGLEMDSRNTTSTQAKSVSLELFSSGDLPLGRAILHRRFNEAMVAFLECLRQLCEHIRSTSGRSSRVEGISLAPYKIEKDKINGVSIKLGVSQDESWTTACKYTLTCCKFLLAHISNIS